MMVDLYLEWLAFRWQYMAPAILMGWIREGTTDDEGEFYAWLDDVIASGEFDG